MTFEYLKMLIYLSLIISKRKRAFEVKQESFCLVSQVLFLRHTKEISKNVTDTTFKFPQDFIKILICQIKFTRKFLPLKT